MLQRRQISLREAARAVPPEVNDWLDRRMVDDVIYAWEVLKEYSPVTTLRDAMVLLIHASAAGNVDPDVLVERRELAALVEAKPSTAASLRRVSENVAIFTRGGATRST